MLQVTHAGPGIQRRDSVPSLRYTINLSDVIVDKDMFQVPIEQLARRIAVPAASAMQSILETLSVSYGSVYQSPGPLRRTSSADAAALVSEYVHWYKQFVDAFENDLNQAGWSKPRRLEYGRQQGIKKLAGLVSLVQARDAAEVMILKDVLDGFRELARFTPDLDGRAVLVVGLVEDVVSRLRELGLIKDGQQSSGNAPRIPPAHSTVAA